MRSLRLRTYLVTIPFLGIIAFPFLNDRFHFISDIPSFENRKLSPKPVMNPGKLDPYPPAFEKYYNDTFALRSRIVSYFNIYNCLLLKKSPYPDKIIIGKYGWLYLGGGDIDAYLGKKFTDAELAALKNKLETDRKYLAANSCKFFVMITPGKANIYPENVPVTYRKINPAGWGEQLQAYLDENSDITIIDLFKPFRQLKSNNLLYYALENHWNHLGAFYAANVAINKMSTGFPGLKPLPLSSYKIVKLPRTLGNMKQMLGNLDFFKDTDIEVIPLKGFAAEDAPKRNYPVPPYFPYPWEYEYEKEIKGSGAPKLLIFSDSFGGHIFPFLSEHFSRTVKIFSGWDYTIRKEVVEAEKPDIVLLMVQEPLIRNILNNN